jgi:amino acid permease
MRSSNLTDSKDIHMSSSLTILIKYSMRMEANKTWIDSKSAESSRSGMKFLQRNKETYPYRSHAQPLLAWISLLMCMIILLGASGAALWDNKGATAVEVIAGYLAVS